MVVTNSKFDEMAGIIAQHFRCDKIDITTNTLAMDIHGWDSLEHVILIMKIEGHFNVELPEDEIFILKDVGELFELVEKALQNAK